MSYEQDYKDMVAELASTGATWFKALEPDEKNKLVAARLLAEPKEDYLCFLTQQCDDKNAVLLAVVAATIRSPSTHTLAQLVKEITNQAREYFAPFIDEDLKAAAVADEYARIEASIAAEYSRGAICEEC